MNSIRIVSLFILFTFCLSKITGQPISTPWGNIDGILVEGEKFEIETSIRSVRPDWKSYVKTEKYNWEGTQIFEKKNDKYIVSHFLQGLPLEFTNKMYGDKHGNAKIEMDIKAKGNVAQAGTYFCCEFLSNDFSKGTITLYKNKKLVKSSKLHELTKKNNVLLLANADKVVLQSEKRNYEIIAKKSFNILLRQDFIDPPKYINDPVPNQKIIEEDPVQKNADFQLYFELVQGEMKKGESCSEIFEIKATGVVNKEIATISINTENPGRSFQGIGGNFRLQFPKNDPEVIKYCLDSLNVNWARVPFYWNEWHSNENDSPYEKVKKGMLNERFYKQMELTKKLACQGAKIVISIWSPPEWAIDKTITVPKGVVLDNDKIVKISKSIASYLLYLKKEYGVEAELFSFNEPDYGVEVRQSPENHYSQNKQIGLYFNKVGLKTKILIADTGSGTKKARDILSEILKDKELHKYAGAISFHTYHGGTNADLKEWGKIANDLNLPIMIAEGGMNSAAHRFEMVFLEPWFQLEEIDTYIRFCNLCQPITILEWQLTSDYSVLTGKGLYNDDGPLRPTQRFWNLKQLGLTPFDAFSLPTISSSNTISSAAFGDIKNDKYAIHLVNNGATRKISIEGLPKNIKKLNVYITDASSGMKKQADVKVIDGVAKIEASALSFITMINYPIE